jgi:hypothetical protein
MDLHDGRITHQGDLASDASVRQLASDGRKRARPDQDLIRARREIDWNGLHDVGAADYQAFSESRYAR